MTSGRRQTQPDLKRIVDEPLESGQSTDHDDSDGQSVPQAAEADVAVDSRHGSAC